MLEALDHLAENGPATLGCRLLLFKPLSDLQIVAPRILFDGRPLLLERDALALAGGGYTDVPIELVLS
jgi:hypothetical protein